MLVLLLMNNNFCFQMSACKRVPGAQIKNSCLDTSLIRPRPTTSSAAVTAALFSYGIQHLYRCSAFAASFVQ